VRTSIAKRWLLLGACLYGVVAAASNAQTVKVEAAMRSDKGTVSFLVRNVSERAIEVDETALPWGFSTKVWTRLETFGKDCKEVERLYPLENEPLVRKYVVFEPGDWMRRDVDLVSRWKDVRTRPKGCQAVLFWSYEMIDRNGISLGRNSGALDLE
jgi:hypothetical protein